PWTLHAPGGCYHPAGPPARPPSPSPAWRPPPTRAARWPPAPRGSSWGAPSCARPTPPPPCARSRGPPRDARQGVRPSRGGPRPRRARRRRRGLRGREPQEPARLVRAAGPLQTTVAVTASRDADALLRIVDQVRPHALQAPADAAFAPV